ncbi:MAG: radical SAM family heme chaperone HemW, partial [Nitriliruptorales bacterium]|nr:radical SAM family heme chaperone HemW [Nitriliruptorales bacterium]
TASTVPAPTVAAEDRHRRDRRWLEDPVECGPAAGFGVYLHVPFCAHRCGYCDFATYDDRDLLMPRYVAALREDLGRIAARSADLPPITSVFVGGGTPTLLPHEDLAGIVRAVGTELDLVPDVEVTVECNPETASEELFGALVAAGVNRLSIGAQSFVPHVLTTLERQHGPEGPVAAVQLARGAGIEQINLDLIYGTPGESEDDWHSTLDRALAANPEHLSCYALTIHPNTAFGRRVRTGVMSEPEDDVQRDRFEVARERLAEAGFEHYEISNWARAPRHRSAHNTLYWRHGNYLGVGVGAHGHRDGHRWWTTRSIEDYITTVEAGGSPLAGEEHLDSGQRRDERLLLGLRLREGLHPVDVPPIAPEALEDAIDQGLVTTSCGRLQATEQGWFLLDEAVARLA